ncbi:MAG: outer membrane protein assembly factor BamD [Anaplasma sp.]
MSSYTAFLRTLFLALSLLFVSQVAVAAEEGVHALYDKVLKSFDKKDYRKAVEVFGKIEALYPFSQMAIDGSLIAAVAHYELGNYAESASLAESYVNVYPNSESIDYAYYVRIIAKYMQISDLGLDQTIAQEVRELATEFVGMFPDSRYAEEVSKRLDAVNKHMAAREFLIGRFYLRRGNYIAAIRRLSALIEDYPSSVYYQESLCGLVEAYAALGDGQIASVYLAKLEDGSLWHTRGRRHLDALLREGIVISRGENAVQQPMPAEKVEVTSQSQQQQLPAAEKVAPGLDAAAKQDDSNKQEANKADNESGQQEEKGKSDHLPVITTAENSKNK